MRKSPRPAKKWTPEEEQTLAAAWPSTPSRELAGQFGVPIDLLKDKAARMGLRKSRDLRYVWCPKDEDYLREHYANSSTRAIAARLGLPAWKVYAKAAKLALEKSAAYIADPSSKCRLQKGSEIGAAYRFPKGHAPANKGLRRPGWSPGRMKETQFKKGGRSGIAAKNWKPIGTIMPDAEGYLRIKVREAAHGKEHTGFGNTKVWPLLNRHVWEQHHGPIPPKHLIVFKDRNRANCAIENLELLSMADNARRNVMWANYPRELAEAIQLQGALKRKMRKMDAEKQD